MNRIYVKEFAQPDFDPIEALRYAQDATPDERTKALANELFAEMQSRLSCRVCYALLPFSVCNDVCSLGSGSVCRIGDISVSSSYLAHSLRYCDSAVLFVATVGIGADRQISKYMKISPSKALISDGIASERVEALCDAFCDHIGAIVQNNRKELCERLSAGYGDIPIELQREIFSYLSVEKNIGVTLTDSYMMTPTKSVSAIIGIKERYLK